MMTNCIVVEDEKPARELLRMYLDKLPGFELVDIFDNTYSAFSFIQSNRIDLMFLDIQIPKMTGLELIKSLKNPPKVIITTAYRDYAVDSFDLDVIDYLLKPISQERFLKAIAKFNSHADNSPLAIDKKYAHDNAYIFLKIGKEQVKVLLKDILYVEGLKDYIKVHTSDTMHVAYDRIGYMEAKLPETYFVRIHKSYIVAIDKISHYTHESIKLGKIELPIGRIYKQNFLRALKQLTQ